MDARKTKNYYAIIMAGGIGSRFWPASKASTPKQFLDVLGTGETLFQTTFKRFSNLIPAENIYVLTNARYVDAIKEQMPQINEEQIVPEPEMRNTAPSILLGAFKIYQKNKDAVMIVAPSDHWIEDEGAFLESVKQGFEYAEEREGLITLGVEPSFPNTGYGYIKYDKSDTADIKKVEQFTEKPTLKRADKFLKEGNYLWNAGIFIWSADFILKNFKEFMPEMWRIFEKGKDLYNTKKEKDFLEKNYSSADNISIDYAILEKSDKVFVIPVNYKWSDLGTWSAIQNELPSDENGNTAVNIRLTAQNSKGNIISTFNPKVVALRGVSDMIIIEDEEILMIVPKSDEQNIKQLREEVMKNFGEDLG